MEMGDERGHAFSIEMTSRVHVRKIVLSNGRGDGVLLEGYLGEIEEVSFVEGVILELRGANGTLRVDVEEGLIQGALEKKRKPV